MTRAEDEYEEMVMLGVTRYEYTRGGAKIRVRSADFAFGRIRLELDEKGRVSHLCLDLKASMAFKKDAEPDLRLLFGSFSEKGVYAADPKKCTVLGRCVVEAMKEMLAEPTPVADLPEEEPGE